MKWKNLCTQGHVFKPREIDGFIDLLWGKVLTSNAVRTLGKWFMDEIMKLKKEFSVCCHMFLPVTRHFIYFYLSLQLVVCLYWWHTVNFAKVWGKFFFPCCLCRGQILFDLPCRWMSQKYLSVWKFRVSDIRQRNQVTETPLARQTSMIFTCPAAKWLVPPPFFFWLDECVQVTHNLMHWSKGEWRLPIYGK